MSNLKEVRWKQRYENFRSSYLLLDKYVDQEEFSELEQAGLIQIFETTFELAWKVMKDYLESEGYQVNSPREAIKKSFEIQLIEDGETWLEALAHRNITVHTYDKSKVEELVFIIKDDYFPLLEALHDTLTEELE